MENWPEEVPRHIDYPEITLGELIGETAEQYPESDAIWFEGWSCTYRELDQMINQFATALVRMGIKKGDVVAIDLPNVPQFIIAFYGVCRVGAVANPIIPLNRFVEIVHQINDSKAKVLLILDSLYEEHLHGKDISKMSSLETVILTGLAEYLPKAKGVLGKLLGKIPYMKEWPKQVGDIEFHELQAFLETGLPLEVPEVEIDVKNDTAVLIYTGGTTGVPKGVMTSHYNLVVNAIQANEWSQKQLPELEATLGDGGMFIVLPLAHSFALSIGMNIAVSNGYKMILFPQPPTPLSKMLKIIKQEGATFGPGVPTLWNKINLDPKSEKYRGELESLVACLSGASALPLEVKQKFEAITGSRIIEGYGMSETSPLLTASPFHKYKENTVGFPVSDTFIKIVDPDEGIKIYEQCPKEDCSKCSVDEAKYIGEICGSGPQVMIGYLNRPEATENALRKDDHGRTWYYTSDIGCIDKDGYLHIKDRKRDMIKYKGHSVFPREVEDLIYMHPAVNEVGVIGAPDPESGQTIKAYISLKEEYQGKITEEEMMDWCKENISPYKYPRIIEIIPELPKSVVGKILRRELRNE
ncbi:MAG: AMP-binding protein [Candidatus Lokiarchaeota archaeon]|nr:AMP-binding protein [Candidatus Lokiarchaeota archaeon]MBD3199614.1 AMP-binding protein [Candidatus Lokiarchaeota archaeon]